MSTSSSANSFFVAIASACSSAPKTVSFGTFFSRASASTNSSILTALHRLLLNSSSGTSLPFPPRRAPIRQRRPSHHYLGPALAAPAFRPPRAAAVARRHLHAHLLGARCTLNSSSRPCSRRRPCGAVQLHAARPQNVQSRVPSQRPVEPGRRHLEPRVVHILDREHMRQLLTHPFAVVRPMPPDPAVDRHAQQPAASRSASTNS